MNIKIITNDSFPVGMANTNRIMSYAKGFTENNCNVSVICMKPTENEKAVFNRASSGMLDGVYFEYAAGKTIISNSYITRQLDNIRGVIKTCVDIIKQKKSAKKDAIIYYTTSTPVAFLIFVITRFKGIIFLKEESEFPFVYTGNMSLIKKWMYNNLHYSIFDGLLLMTKKLIKYFKEERELKAPYLHVPMTVDFERFGKLNNKESDEQYIAYCGSLNNKKDGVDVLIDAFSLLAHEYPNISLYLVGDFASKEEQELYLNKVTQNQLTKKVVFKGRLGREAIPELLSKASILVLPRPASMQAEGGFPTKLGEYLSTSKPVIVTKVGEIAEYLTNDVNVFMAEPGDIASLVAAMKKILENYSRALEIGAKGRQVVLEHFNYKIQAKNIIDFIENLKMVDSTLKTSNTHNFNYQ